MGHMISAGERINEEVMITNIRRGWGMFFREGSVVEVRIFLRSYTRSKLWTGSGDIISGYFDDLETLTRLIVEIEKTVAPQATYITLNPVDPVLKSRSYNRLHPARRGETTPDKHIVTRSWLLIDLDPIRPNGIAASDEEVAAALDRSVVVRDALTARGWPEPIIEMSGNGYHLYYALLLDNGDQERTLLSDTLNGLQLQFGDKEDSKELGSAVEEGQIGVRIDVSVFNAARLTKLPGTWTRKGDEVDGRVHRQSYILKMPDEITAVPPAMLEGEAALYRQYVAEVEEAKQRDRARQHNGHETIIERFKREHPLSEVMIRHGYAHAQGNRWNHPNGDGKSVLVGDDGRSKHFSTNDPLHGSRRDAFDYEVAFTFGGDQGAAIAYWAAQYGVVLRRNGANHRNGSTNGHAEHYVNLRSEPPPEPAPKETPATDATKVNKLLFETFLENMRLRVNQLFNREFAISCLYDNENGNARLLFSVIGSLVVYDHTEKQWYWFNNLYWQVDDQSNIFYLASEVLRYTYDLLGTRLSTEVKALKDAQDSEYDENRANEMERTERMAKLAFTRSKELCNITPIRNMLAFAVAGERLGIKGDEWDQNIKRE